jgi:uncharacterized membrane protein YccF (DUF307 family)
MAAPDGAADQAEPCSDGGMRTLLNVIWFVFSGFWLALSYAALGVLMCLLVVTIPFGIALFRLAGFVIWPFGRTVVPSPGAGVASSVGNVIWFVIAGVWIAIAHVSTAIALCLTIIGIPMAIPNLKLAVIALNPLGKEVVDAHDPRAHGALVW